MPKPETIRERRRRLADKAPELAEMVRGSVVERRTRCGKPNCACATDDSARHGPYHYLVVTEGVGKTRTVFIPADMVLEVRRWSANYQALKRTLEAITAASCDLLAAERSQRKPPSRRPR